MSCCQPNAFEQVFDKAIAKRELKKLKRSGAKKSTEILVDEIRKLGSVANKTLLDIGGGAGAIPFAMINDDLAAVTNVDASAAYQNVVLEEAERREQSDLFQFYYGDFVELADRIDASDIVTLDRVICCYEDMESLVGRSVDKANQIYAVVFPRSVWSNEILFRLANLSLWIMRKAFRTYLHDTSVVDALIRSKGFKTRYHKDLLIWQVSVYERIA